MGKISDIWVRLGLKKQEYDKGMDDAAKKAEKTGGRMSKMLGAAKAGWAAVGAAVIAFGHEMIQATNRVGDAWSHTMAQIRGGWHSMLADISNYKPDFSSFSNFFKNEFAWIRRLFGNAKEAGDAAKEMSEAFDKEFELVNSVRLQKELISGELNELYIRMRDTTLSAQDRQAAADRYKALLQPLANAEIAIYTEMMQKASEAWQAGSDGMLSRAYSMQEMLDFFSTYGTDAAGAAAKYPELMKVYENRKGDKANQVIFDTATKLAAAQNEMSRVDKEMARTYLSIKKSVESMYNIGGDTTETILVQTMKELKDTVAEEVAEVNKEFKELGDVEPEIDMASIDAITEAFVLKLKDSAMRMRTGLQENGGPAGFRFSLPEMDTTSLENGLAEVRRLIGEYDSILNQIQNGDIVLPAVDVSALEASLAELLQVEEDFQKRLDLILDMSRMTADAIVSSVANGLQALMDVAAGVEGADMKSALAAFIAPFGDTMKQMGAMIMAEGLAMMAFKKSFSTPEAAVAAGAALMAIGSAVSAGLQRLTANPAGGGTAASYGGSGSYGSTELTNYESTITVEVVGRLTGSDILIAGKKTQDKWNR